MKHVRQWIQVVLATALVLVILGGTAQAAVPGNMAFSGHLADASGPLDGSVALTFRLFNAAVDGTQVWAETQGATAEQGLVLVELGLETPLSETIFDGSALFLEVVVNGTALSPRAPIGTVPYAFAANHADHADHADSATHADHAETASHASDSNQLGGVPASGWQRRVTGGCDEGSSIRAISVDGGVTCQPDTNSVYTAGSGLSLNGGTFQIASLGVTASHLAGGSVTNAKIFDGAVTTVKIANSAVTTAKIAAGNVTSTTIADGAVTTAKIADAQVTGAKLANATIHGPGTATNKRNCALLSFNGSAACTVTVPADRPGNWSLTGTGCQWICM
jgi:hypothetical protein